MPAPKIEPAAGSLTTYSVVGPESARPSRDYCPPSVALLTGGFDRPYTYGLATALAAAGTSVEIIGSDQLDFPEFHTTPRIRFLNLRGDQTASASFPVKVIRVVAYYLRLLRYAVTARPRIFHILWNNKFQTIDRTALMLFYKALGKRLIVTAHNINQARRDGRDSRWNRLTLRVQYLLADRIFVHTEGMQERLCDWFRISKGKVRVIPFGINNSVADTHITSVEARAALGLGPDDRVILFFGSIRPYKGLEYLVEAFRSLAAADARYRLVIAGAPHFGDAGYSDQVRTAVAASGCAQRISLRIEYVPDEQIELFFKAADLLVLPYRDISWSGVLVLAYTLGLPVVATDVGAMREEVDEGRTGFLCRPADPGALAAAIAKFFTSSLYLDSATARNELREYSRRRYGWSAVTGAMRSEFERLVATSDGEGTSPSSRSGPASCRSGGGAQDA